MPYALAHSNEEVERFRWLAEIAAGFEGDAWAAAGVRAGARVAEIGCGPGAILAQLAQRVGAEGHVVGIDESPHALTLANNEIADVAQAEVHLASAMETGLAPGSFDVVMCRHVLGHHRREEEVAIVSHLASLCAPGGALYLVDVDYEALHYSHDEPDLDDLVERYIAFQRARGCDLETGLRLGDLLVDVGFNVERYFCGGPVLPRPEGARYPAWAARDAMVAEGFATPDDIQRWNGAFARQDASERRPLFFPLGACFAVGRRA